MRVIKATAPRDLGPALCNAGSRRGAGVNPLLPWSRAGGLGQLALALQPLAPKPEGWGLSDPEFTHDSPDLQSGSPGDRACQEEAGPARSSAGPELSGSGPLGRDTRSLSARVCQGKTTNHGLLHHRTALRHWVRTPSLQGKGRRVPYASPWEVAQAHSYWAVLGPGEATGELAEGQEGSGPCSLRVCVWGGGEATGCPWMELGSCQGRVAWRPEVNPDGISGEVPAPQSEWQQRGERDQRLQWGWGHQAWGRGAEPAAGELRSHCGLSSLAFRLSRGTRPTGDRQSTRARQAGLGRRSCVIPHKHDHGGRLGQEVVALVGTTVGLG